MDEYQRKRLLERVDRDGATVGECIPERIDLGPAADTNGSTLDARGSTVEGESFPLRRFVTDPDGFDRSVDDVVVALRRARTDRHERLEAGDVDGETGEGFADEIVGIDRALNALGSEPAEDLEAVAERQEAADDERWFRFLRKALGHEDDERGARPPPEGNP